MADATVRAPFAGIVAKRHVEVGDYLGPGTPVLQLANIDQVKIKVELPPGEALLVKPGDRAKLYVDPLLPPGKTKRKWPVVAAKVKAVSAVAQPVTRRVEVELLADNPGTLKAGMIARVEIRLGPKRRALFIPQDAVIKRFGILYVFVFKANRAERRLVKLGVVKRGRVEVLSGLKEGEQVVVVGQERLRKGAFIVLEGEKAKSSVKK